MNLTCTTTKTPQKIILIDGDGTEYIKFYSTNISIYILIISIIFVQFIYKVFVFFFLNIACYQRNFNMSLLKEKQIYFHFFGIIMCKRMI